MSVILTADDLSAGMFVSIHSTKVSRRIRVHPSDRADAAIEFDDAVPTPAPVGLPLKVIGVSFPFVACAVLRPGGGLDGPVIIDLRTVHLSRLTAEFVTAIERFATSDSEAESHADVPAEPDEATHASSDT